MQEFKSPIPKNPVQNKVESLEAIRAQISKERNYVINFCRKLLLERDGGKHIEMAEDLGSEIITKAFERAAQYKGESALQTWLGTITRNAVSDFLRKKGNKFSASNISLDDTDDKNHKLFEFADTRPNPEEDLLTGEQMKFLNKYIGALPPKQRQALELQTSEDNQKEAAQKMGVTTSTYKGLLFRAKKALREKLNSRNI